ncbi:Diaminopimelate epimerase-like protein [Xylaria telfairii]|nr:Diaminopimelate epimerase-like protein [Xylaria telfairii]
MKQKIAREFNLSETVFLHDDTSKSGPETREVDIFTIDRELPFAGHPTIGTAVFVRHHLPGGEGVRTLAIKAGAIGIEPLPALPRGIRAQIPHNTHLHAKTLRDVLTPSAAGLHTHPAIREAELDAPVFSCVRGMTFVLVPLPSLELLGEVRILPLGFDALSESLLDEGWRDGFAARYYYVDVGREGGRRCLRTRMLEPGFEDPATGSAATCLGLYLTLAQEKKATTFQMTQGVEMGRKSIISVETTVGDGGELAQVYLGGTAVVVMQGTLRVDV